jgi:uncharacterized protein
MSSRHHHRTLPATLLALAALVAGCATHADRLREIRSEFYAGNVETAGIQIDRYLKSYGREADCLKLDRAVVELAAGRPRQAEQLLREVRDSLDYLQQTSLAEQGGSMLTDDNITSYAGEDYERILIRDMLALTNLMSSGDDATAYALQGDDLQERIIQAGTDETGQNFKLAYKRVALGPYIHGMLREQTHMDYDDAARSWVKVCSWEPSFPYGRYDVERAVHGRHSARGNGVLYVFSLVGRGPYKEQHEETGATIAMLVGDRIFSYTGKHTLPPTIATIKVPKVVRAHQILSTRSVQVAVDGRAAGETATITDVGQLATQQYDAVYPRILAKAVARRMVKKGLIYGAKEGLKVSNNSLANIAMDVAGVAWEATETADTRCWGLLPDQIQVLRLELPAGEHQINLRALGGLGMDGEHQKTVRIADGRNTYLLATFADGRLIGNIMASEK